LVLRAQAVRAVWPDTHVGDGLLRGYVRDLRTVLEDDQCPALRDGGAPRYLRRPVRRLIEPVAAVCGRCSSRRTS
jgi:hypothetical protein